VIDRLRRLAARARRGALTGPASEAVQTLSATPLISVVMPTYETPARYLREAVDSVRTQHYPAWELCIADDGSRSPEVRRMIASQAAADDRIEAVYLGDNGGISAASNAALELASGEFVAFLDHDDVLTDDALLRVAQVLTAEPDTDVVYSDSDKLTLHGRRADPFHKPDWSPVYALGAMYVGHLLVVRRSLVERAGGFDPGFDKIQDFELILRLSELTDRIRHIPRILYHWRAIPGSIAAGALEKSGVPELQARAVTEHLRRIGAEAVAVPHPRIPHRAQLAAADAGGERPGSVDAVIAWSGEPAPLLRLLDSIRAQGPAALGRLIVVAEGELPAGAGEAAELVRDPGPGFSRGRAANLGAAAATAEHLLFCSPAIELVEPNSIEALLLHARLPGVAAAGALLVRPDGRADAAGFAVGLEAPAMPMLGGLDADADGYYGALVCAREVSALSADCLLVERVAFEAAGGFCEWYSTEYDDYDLCQRLQQRGSRVVYTPRPRVVTHQLPSHRRGRVDVIDRALFVDSWYECLERGDPYYNPSFARERADYEPGGRPR